MDNLPTSDGQQAQEEIRSRLFVRDAEKWAKHIASLRPLGGAAAVDVYEGATLLPLRIAREEMAAPGKPALDAVYNGGVVDSEGQFVAGRMRYDKAPGNLGCAGAYEVQADNVKVRAERVLFGGILYHHLGHMLVDGFARLWYAVDHDDFDKVVFLDCPFEFASDFDPLLLLKLFGLDESRIEVIGEPTRFAQVIVPEEAMRPFGSFRRELTLPFDKIRQEIERKGSQSAAAEKVYLSRRAYQEGGGDNGIAPSIIYNEEWFEEFYARRGFAVVHPETLPVEQQIATIIGAKEIVSTVGTMTHLLLFAKPDARVAELNRAGMVEAQLRIDAVRGLSPYYVDVASNPLPVAHARGPFLMMPNRHFRGYLAAAGIDYASAELDLSEHTGELLKEFLEDWAVVYRAEGTSGLVARRTMFDVILQMNEFLFDDPFDKSAYREANTLLEETRELRKELKKAKHDVKMQQDASKLKASVGSFIRKAVLSRK